MKGYSYWISSGNDVEYSDCPSTPLEQDEWLEVSPDSLAFFFSEDFVGITADEKLAKVQSYRNAPEDFITSMVKVLTGMEPEAWFVEAAKRHFDEVADEQEQWLENKV